MKSAVFTTHSGTEVEVRGIQHAIVLDIIQAAANLADRVEIITNEDGPYDREEGILLSTPILAGGQLELAVFPVEEIEEFDEDEDELDEVIVPGEQVPESLDQQAQADVEKAELGGQTLTSTGMLNVTQLLATVGEKAQNSSQEEIDRAIEKTIDAELPSDAPLELREGLKAFLQDLIKDLKHAHNDGPPSEDEPVPEGMYRCRLCHFFHDLPDPEEL